MKHTDDVNPEILRKIERNDGMTMPEGWLDDFAARMSASLPERPELEAPDKIMEVPRTLWQRVRPYVYLAAMFAGVWCMLKMVALIGAGSSPSTIDNSPILAEAFADEGFVNDYIYDDVSEWDLIDDMIDEGFDIESLCDDFWADDADDSAAVTDLNLPQAD